MPIDLNGRVIYGPRSSNPSTTNEGDQYYHTGDDKMKLYDGSEWVDLKPGGENGTENKPFTTFANISTENPGDGVHWVKFSGMAAKLKTYLVRQNNVWWAAAWSVTNSDGAGADWWAGDVQSSTNYFITDNTLNPTSLETLAKDNAKNAIYHEVSFSKMLVKEDHSGTIGWKAFTLNATKKFGGASGTRWISSAANSNNTTSDVVSSVDYTSGSFSTFTTSNIYFDYKLGDDGGRILSTLVSSECSGGVASRVDGGAGYNWTGNLTRSDSNRHYNSDGTTTDHTAWFFITGS